MKNFRDVLREVEGPRTADAKKFVNDFHRRHLTLDADDPENDHLFTASDIAKDHSKKNGYKPGEDVKAYAAAQGRSKIVKAADNDESKLPNKTSGPNVPNMVVNPDPNVDPVPTKKTTDFAAESTEHEDAARQNLHDVKNDLDGIETLDLRTSKARDLLNILATAHKAASGVQEEVIDELSKGTYRNYVTKAVSDAGTHNFASGIAYGKNSSAGAHIKKATKREKGIRAAVERLTKEDLDIDEGRFQIGWKSNSKFQGKPLSSHTFSVKAKNQDEAIKRAQKYIEKTDASDNAHAVVPHNVFRVSEDHEWPAGTTVLDELSTYTMKNYLNKSLRQELQGGKKRKMRGLAARKVNDKELRGVSEEVVDELSKPVLQRYATKADADADRLTDKKRIKKALNRTVGVERAKSKLGEGVVNEVSKSLLRRYWDKAQKWQSAADGDHPPDNAFDVVNSVERPGKKTFKYNQRASHMDRAQSKLTGLANTKSAETRIRATEETELDELSALTLGRYSRAAKLDSHWRRNSARDIESRHGRSADTDAMFAKARKREVGSRLAQKKLNAKLGEATELDELSTRTLASYASKAHTSARGHQAFASHWDREAFNARTHDDAAAANAKRDKHNRIADRRSRGVGKAMGRVMARNEELALDETFSEIRDLQFSTAFELLEHIADLLELASHDEEAYYASAAKSPDSIASVSPSRLWSTDLGFLVRQLQEVRDALLAAKPEDEEASDDE